jgi:DedD protein
MRGVFDDEEDVERRKSGGDTELTLSTGTVLFLFVGLIILCGACFGLGYMVGHRGSPSQAAVLPPAGTAAVSQPESLPAKPTATTKHPAPAAAPASPTSSDASQTAAATPPKSKTTVTVPIAPTTGTESSSESAQPKVRPALPATAAPQATYPSHPADTASNASQQQSRSAGTSQSAIFWVQVAAVSRVDDAKVLANALTRHGYAVTARRDADNLIHVLIGPFNSRDEANRWRTKLLGDGYNAEIQP